MANSSFFSSSGSSAITPNDFALLQASLASLLTQVLGASNSAVASVALPARSLIYIKADGTVALADATAEGKEADGFISLPYDLGTTATYYTVGGTMGGLTGLTPGVDYFMGTTPGTLTSVVPTTTGNVVLKVGTALSTTQLLFKPETPITL